MLKFKKTLILLISIMLMVVFSTGAYAENTKIPNQKEVKQSKDVKSDDLVITTDLEENKKLAQKNKYPFSIIDNPELFAAANPYENWTLYWSNPWSTSNDYYVNMYGVVKLYKANDKNTSYDFWGLEMLSNIIGKEQYVNGAYRKSGISKLRWRIDETQDKGTNAHVSRWAPVGTSTSDGQKITASLAPSYQGISLGSIGTDFTIWEDTLRAYSGTNYFDVEWEKSVGLFSDPIIYPDTCYLNGTVEWTAKTGTALTWSWNWYWTYWYWY